ncbi:hypothetical protein NE865_02307 [Phthorimaea operculella]|nr:hypothetical protein NE865_02307 [Phthorimaea operculella]
MPDTKQADIVMYSSIQQPAAMQEHGNMAVNWREWKCAFDYFMIASGRQNTSSEEKIAVFLHVIGKYGREIYQEFDLKSTATYDDVVKEFKAKFDPEKNVNFERHVFFETYQKDSEFDRFVSELKLKSKSCEFGSLRDSLILTQLIRGIRDPYLKERLLAKTPLTLDEAVTSCRAAEQASSQAAACSSAAAAPGHSRSDEVAYVSGGGVRGPGGGAGEARGPRGRRRARGRRGVGSGGGAEPSRLAPSGGAGAGGGSARLPMCSKCGGRHSASGRCPAYGVICYRCERANHFAKCCNARYVRELLDCSENDDDTEDMVDVGELFINNISIDSVDQSWTESVYVNDVAIKFKLDSGADTTVLSKKSFLDAGFNLKMLKKTGTVLKEISKNKLPVLG